MYEDRYYRRQMRRRYRNPLGGLAVGIFIIGLAFAFYFSKTFGGNLFLPILFAGLAFCSLFGSASSGDPKGLYGGLQGFTWLMGLALCFLIGFWPWILLPVGVSKPYHNRHEQYWLHGCAAVKSTTTPAIPATISTIPARLSTSASSAWYLSRRWAAVPIPASA